MHIAYISTAGPLPLDTLQGTQRTRNWMFTSSGEMVQWISVVISKRPRCVGALPPLDLRVNIDPVCKSLCFVLNTREVVVLCAIYQYQIHTPSSKHSLAHKLGFWSGKHCDEELVHVDCLDQHPHKRRKNEVMCEHSNSSAHIHNHHQTSVHILLNCHQQECQIHQEQWYAEIQKYLTWSITVQTPATNHKLPVSNE